jgi:hypothetical protein
VVHDAAPPRWITEQVRRTVYVDHAPTAAGEVMPLKRQRASVPAA